MNGVLKVELDLLNEALLTAYWLMADVMVIPAVKYPNSVIYTATMWIFGDHGRQVISSTASLEAVRMRTTSSRIGKHERKIPVDGLPRYGAISIACAANFLMSGSTRTKFGSAEVWNCCAQNVD